MVFIGVITSTEWIIILVIVIILFGGRKIPELMHSLGRGVSEFKKGKEGIEDDLNTNKKIEQKKQIKQIIILLDSYTDGVLGSYRRVT